MYPPRRSEDVQGCNSEEALSEQMEPISNFALTVEKILIGLSPYLNPRFT
jgi:hypothetical protein